MKFFVLSLLILTAKVKVGIREFIFDFTAYLEKKNLQISR